MSQSKTIARVGLAIILIMVAVLSVLALLLTKHAVAEQPDANLGGTILIIHDGDNTSSVVTHSTTIGSALKDAGVSISKQDVVEPSIDHKIIGTKYQVNIYRARPVLIVDGHTRVKIMTAYSTGTQITNQAGITVYPEDKTSFERSDNPVRDGADLKIVITRATTFQFNLYGQTSTQRTQAKTVGDMLAEKGIDIGSSDRVAPDPSTPITPGMTIQVWREGQQTINVTEPLNFTTQKVYDADQPVGYTKITTPGVNGQQQVTYQINIVNGVEVSRTSIASIVITPSVTQVEVIGTMRLGVYTTPLANENAVWDYLMSHGFNRVQTAGIMGNLEQEHHFKTADVSGGLGIVQWTGSRRTNLINFAASQGRSYLDLDIQLDFLMSELNGGYAKVKNAILAANSVDDVVEIFQNRFEKCNPRYCMQDQRLTYAYNILASH